MLKRLIPLAVAGAFAAAPAVAAADITLAVGQPEVTAGVSVSVPVTVTCTVADASFALSSESLSVTISQAVSKTDIASGFGGFMLFGATPPPFPCDGTPATLPITVAASNAGPPFKRNKEAVVNASASVSGSGATGFVSQSGFSGPVAVKLK